MSLHVEGSTQVQVPRSLMQAFLQQDPNHPGLETVRLPTPLSGPEENGPPALFAPPSQHCRELETELCLVCRRCGRAYPQESALLAHQRSCYLGNQQRRGALRLVQSRYACSLCDGNNPARTYASLAEWRRHADTLQHRARLEANNTDRQQHRQQQFTSIEPESGGQCGEEVHPLIEEMEDVVNQITLLAARAAAESTTTATTAATTITTTNSQQPLTSERPPTQENNNAPELKRQKMIQEVAALAGAR
ncbi:uncharacterized protein LOC143430139 [Xylocopa sonorina]|uniref:uncharacterized protein LOC143430139 n=1 Tax=Xylocopa sonorina TaxID=1818115 RepID=UPI00403AB001